MSKGKREPELRKGTAYLYEDEWEAVAKVAELERCSQAEIIRRAVRAYLELRDETRVVSRR